MNHNNKSFEPVRPMIVEIKKTNQAQFNHCG